MHKKKTKAERWEDHQKSSHIHNRLGPINGATGERYSPSYWYKSINHMTVTVSHVHGAFKQSKGMYHDFAKSFSAKCFQYMHLPSYSVGLFEECVFDILDILQNSTEMLGEYYFSAIEKLLKKLASGHSGWSESLIYLVEDAHHECPYFYRRIREICESVPGYPCDKNEPPKRIKYTAVPDGHNTVNNQRNNAKLVAEPFFTN